MSMSLVFVKKVLDIMNLNVRVKASQNLKKTFKDINLKLEWCYMKL